MFHSLEIVNNPDGSWAESIRGLATLVKRQLKNNIQCILLTSAWPGEGKSTICANLAVASAQLDVPTLLVDGDLRNPTLTRWRGAEERAGFCEALAGEGAAPAETTEFAHLSFCGAGRTHQFTIGDLLAQGRLPSVVAELRRQAQLMIFDCAPVGPCKDALLLGPVVDGVYLVVHERKFLGVPEGHLSEDLRDAGATILGAIVNASEHLPASDPPPKKGKRFFPLR